MTDAYVQRLADAARRAVPGTPGLTVLRLVEAVLKEQAEIHRSDVCVRATVLLGELEENRRRLPPGI